MANKTPKADITEENKTTENEAFEMIELAIEDFGVLARAFKVITDACQEKASDEIEDSKDWVH